MKKVSLFAALIVVFFGSSSMKQAESLKWQDFNDGYSYGKKKNKIVLVDVYTDWCYWCKVMDRETYTNSEVISMLNKDYVLVKFNPEKSGITYKYNGKSYDGMALAGAISNNTLSGYPTTIFINPKTHKTEMVVGFKKAEQLKEILAGMKNKLGAN